MGHSTLSYGWGFFRIHCIKLQILKSSFPCYGGKLNLWILHEIGILWLWTAINTILGYHMVENHFGLHISVSPCVFLDGLRLCSNFTAVSWSHCNKQHWSTLSQSELHPKLPWNAVEIHSSLLMNTPTGQFSIKRIMES